MNFFQGEAPPPKKKLGPTKVAPKAYVVKHYFFLLIKRSLHTKFGPSILNKNAQRCIEAQFIN